MWKYFVEREDRPQKTIWRMCVAGWIPKAKYIHSEYVIVIAFPVQQRLHEHVSMLSYTYIACLVQNSLHSEPRRLFLFSLGTLELVNNLDTDQAVIYRAQATYQSRCIFLERFSNCICCSTSLELQRRTTSKQSSRRTRRNCAM
jgi:hypothetical protein